MTAGGARGLGADRAAGGLVRVVEVEHLGGRSLRVQFSDRLVRELDLTGQLTGVLAVIDDDVAFGRVSVDPVAGTVCWVAGVDLDPDVLHGDASPAGAFRPRLLREYGP